MTLQELFPLKNTYSIIRHGQSQANVEGVVVSHPENGVEGYGLTPKGREQVQGSVEQALKDGTLNARVRIMSSDFLRARQTAEIAQAILGTPSLSFDTRLRERFFGRYEKSKGEIYDLVWERDRKQLDHQETRVEDVEALFDRLLQLLGETERAFENEHILFVSHGDTLQILETAFRGMPLWQHRSLPVLQNAEIRHLSYVH